MDGQSSRLLKPSVALALGSIGIELLQPSAPYFARPAMKPLLMIYKPNCPHPITSTPTRASCE